jgi:hypothetical protein
METAREVCHVFSLVRPRSGSLEPANQRRVGAVDRTTPASSSSRPPEIQMLLERDRVVVLGVLGAEDQGDAASPGSLDELLEGIRTLLEFPGVTLLELVPLLRVVPEPFSEAGARRQVLEPGVDLEVVPWRCPAARCGRSECDNHRSSRARRRRVSDRST